jgi:hypothetical protein
MFVTVEIVSELGDFDEFVYSASLTEQNEDTLDYVWSDLSDEEIIIEMMDRAMEQVRCLFPEDHKVLSARFEW